MNSLRKLALAASAVFFIAPALAQNAGTVTNHAFVIGTGPNSTGYTSLLCGSAQLAVGQAAADPICRTLTGDVSIDAAGATTVTSTFLNASHLWGAFQTLTINQNASTFWNITNNSAGVSALVSYALDNGTGTGSFGLGGTGYTGFSSVLQNRAYVFASTATNGVAIFAEGADPINFYNGGTLSGAFSSAGVFSLTTPLAASSGGTGLSALGAGCATWLGTPSSANLRGCVSDETGTGLIYFQGGDIGTPSAGNGSNLTSLNATQLTSGTIAPGRTNGHQNGTATNDNAAAGEVGELISASVVVGSAVALTTSTAANITSISLTAGDWDVSACASFLPAGTTSVTQYVGTISTTSATLNTTPGNIASFTQAAAVPGNLQSHFCISPVRFSLSGATTVFLVSQTTHTVSTMGGFGTIRGRRMR